MQYQSVKQSVILYQKEKKNKQTPQEKLIFRWKLFTLGLAICTIVLLGLLSQIFKELNNNPISQFNTSFLTKLLEETEILQTRQEVGNFIKGLNISTQINFDTITLIHRGKQLGSATLRNAVKGKDNLIYLFKTTTGQTFGTFIKKQFPLKWEDQIENNTVNVIEARNYKRSVLFNIEDDKSFRLNHTYQCFVYVYQDENPDLMTIFQLMQFDDTGLYVVNMKITNSNCYAQTQEEAEQIVFNTTGIDVSAGGAQAVMEKIQIYRLDLD